MDSISPHVGNDSPPSQQQPRSTILGSFLRGRPRGTSQSHINLHVVDTPAPPAQLPSSPGVSAHRRRPGGALALVNQSSAPQPSMPQPPTTMTASVGLAHMLRRRRSAGTMLPQPIFGATGSSPVSAGVAAPTAAAPTPPIPPSTAYPRPSTAVNPPSNSNSTTSHRIRLVPQLDSRRSLRFEAISREVKEGDPPLRIGRFTDRSGLGLAAVNAMGSNKLAFKSKVVSRAHAEIWVEGAGFYIKDTKSSSGTFLNHIRLSPANTESRPHPIKDGDILQLGVDYQGGTEDIYKSVKIRIEVGREWQASANAFNTNALKNLKMLAVGPLANMGLAAVKISKSGIPDCCICLFSVTIRQALFIAPCSHTFHYKCIRPLLETHHPAFSCPLCRTYADLEEDVEIEADVEAGRDGDAEGGGQDGDDDSAPEGVSGALASTPLPDGVTSMAESPVGAITLRPMTAVAVPPPPPVLLEHSRQVPERDTGAETEVEAEGRTRDLQPEVLVDVAESRASGEEDEDEDMVDLTSRHGPFHSGALGTLHEDGNRIVDSGQEQVFVGQAEYEGEGSRSPGDLADETGGIMMDEEFDADGTIGGKRKR